MGSVSDTARAAALGLAAGARSTLGGMPLWDGAGPKVRAFLAVAALGEFAADKAPGMPSRTAAPSLAARVLSAGTGGFLLARRLGSPPLPAALVAAAVSPAGAVAGVEWRRYWSGTGRPAWAGGVIEDTCVLALARAACRGPG